MPVVTRTELENAQRDVDDLRKVINGAADLPNPGQSVGTVTTREGRVIKTLAKLVVDGQTTVEQRLSPIIYNTTLERNAGLGNVNVVAGVSCFDKQDNNLYILVIEQVGIPPVDTKVWYQLSRLDRAVTADWDQLLRQTGEVGRISVEDWQFLDERDKLFDKDALTVHHIEFPGKSTLNEGLAKALNYTTWPTAHHLSVTSDYGCPVPTNELTPIDAPVASGGWVDWDATIKRAQIRNNNPNYLENYYIPGFVDINSAYAQSVYIKNCYIDPNFGSFQAISKANDETFGLFVDHCTIRRFLNEATAPNFGHLAYCDIELSRGDGLKAAGHDINFHGNMVRLLGQLASAHADALQVWDCDRMTITQNTFYMPGTGRIQWDEGAYGTTQCLRLITESDANVLRDIYVAGNVFIGGGFTLAVRSRYTNSLVENVAIVNNVIGGTEAGTPYWVYGPITKEHWVPSGSPGFIRNLLIWGNKMTDGTALSAEGSGGPQTGTDQQGLWHYSKAYASPRFLEIGKRLGVLDWNGDPLVPVRTTG